MDLKIADKRALVMGASRGLGRAVAEGLLAEGVQVIAVGRNADTIRNWAGDAPHGKTQLFQASLVSALLQRSPL